MTPEPLPATLTVTDQLVDKHFVLTPDFHWDPSKCAIKIPKGAERVLIKNVVIESGHKQWDPRWNTPETQYDKPDGVPAGCRGIWGENNPGLQLENVEVDGFPAQAIDVHGVTGGVFRKIRSRHCFQALILRQYSENKRVLIEDVDVSDTWSGNPANYPSLERPGGWVGSDGVFVHRLYDSMVRGVRSFGEIERCIKAVQCFNTIFEDILGGTFQMQGFTYAHGNYPDQPPNAPEEMSTGCIVRNSIFTKDREYGGASMGGHQVQLTWGIKDLLFENVEFNSAGRIGHGTQHYDRCMATYKNCSFVGFNRKGGGNSTTTAYAAEVLVNSQVNPAANDFRKANFFYGQNQIVRSA